MYRATLPLPDPCLNFSIFACTLSGLSFLPADLQLLDDYLPLLLVVDSHGPGRVHGIAWMSSSLKLLK